MDLEVPKGKYVLAVSGGVDSMVLLDLLSNSPGLELIVAHFNHGIRRDAAEDEALVAQAAVKYGLKLEAGRTSLGSGASEDAARQARYDFLYKVLRKHGADKIITAHHQDDLIETALINLIRGTGRRGLSAISSNPQVLRPLLNTPKREIIEYAETRGVQWREDATNQSADYLRNYLRHNLLSGLSSSQRRQLVEGLGKISSLNSEIDKDVALLSDFVGGPSIDRQLFSALPAAVGNELLVYQLRGHDIRDFDAATINRLNVAIRTAKSGTTHDIKRQARLKITADKAELLTV